LIVAAAPARAHFGVFEGLTGRKCSCSAQRRTSASKVAILTNPVPGGERALAFSRPARIACLTESPNAHAGELVVAK